MINVTVLGCGASAGVPSIGCKCAVCTSTNPKNKRTRVSVFLQVGDTNILVDTSPDLRQQVLREDIHKIDAIIYTHDHADHLNGVDDLRAFNHFKNAPIDAYSDAQTLARIKARFDYVFLPPKPHAQGWYRPCLTPITVTPYNPFMIDKVKVLPIEQQHGQGTSLGLRIGNFAYSTDTNGLSDKALDALEGLDTWVVDCLRFTPAPTHAHLEMTLGWIARVQPKRAFLTHMHHEFDYDALSAQLPEGIFPAYDGLKFSV